MRLSRLTVCALVFAAALPRAETLPRALAQIPGGPPAASAPAETSVGAGGTAAPGSAALPTAAAPPAAADCPLFPTSRPIFDIPFQIDEPIPGQEPVQVQLHTSEDRGATWKLFDKVEPNVGRFTFRAERDGEYWFLVRTLNRVGKLLPDKPPAPELRVLVDTVPPQIELTCSRTTSGEISANWRCADPQLKVETLELSYQGVDDGAQWRRVVTAPSQPGPDGKWIGQATFSPRDARPPHYVKVEVSDSAGNRAAAQQQISASGETAPNPSALPVTKTPDTASASPGSTSSSTPFASQSRAPYADDSTSNLQKPAPAQDATRGRPWPAVAAPMASPVPPPREAIGPPPPDGGVAGPNVLRQGPPSMSPAFPGGRQLSPWGENVPPRKTPPTYTPASSPSTVAGSPRATAKPPAGEEPESLPLPEQLPDGSTASDGSRGPTPISGPIGGPIGGGPSVGYSTGPSLTGPSFDGGAPAPLGPLGNPSGIGPDVPAPIAGDGAPPSGVRPRLVNSRKFELDYDVESVGPSGVAKVELWATRDGGKSWKSYGADPDSTSPYLVNVEGEGTYGFRMVIESTTGLRSPQPQPGDLPEIWIGVDVTKPSVRITAAVPGTGEHAGELIIEWTAEDTALAPRPVGLSFADRLDGPWTIIASGVPNQGSYAWRLDNRAPERLYLKLDVRDEAGNVGTFVTPDAVSLTRVKPQGKIRGVRPIGESARLRLPAEITPR
jgi:hypothetical protein